MSEKRTYSSEVARDSARYEEIWKSKKSIDSAVVSLDEVSAHSCTLQRIVLVLRDIDNAEMSIDVRGHWSHVADYSFRLFDKNFMGCAIGRLDIAGRSHDNLGMDIPMKLVRVKTPHFHKFNSYGFEYAYRTQAIEDNEWSMRMDRSIGLRCFLEEERIKYKGPVRLSSNSLLQPTNVELDDPLKGVAL